MEKKYYRTYSEHLKEKYGEKVYKLPINLPITCPNRIHASGCSFCDDCGTGFEAMESIHSVCEQINTTKEKITKKYKAKKFIAYFQNYTNTFMPIEQFRQYVTEAAACDDIVEISISTRPDCIRTPYLDVLKMIEDKYHIAIVIEMGLQTVNYHTLKKMNRGHGLAEFMDAVLMIQKYGFHIGVHMILNLPGDTMEDVTEAAKILSALPIHIVKLHSLYISKKSTLYEQYQNGTIQLCTKEEYMERVTEFLALLRPDVVVERIFSRVPQEYAVFSNWDTSWWKLMDEFELRMQNKNYVQGCKFNYLGGAALDKLEESWG